VVLRALLSFSFQCTPKSIALRTVLLHVVFSCASQAVLLLFFRQEFSPRAPPPTSFFRPRRVVAVEASLNSFSFRFLVEGALLSSTERTFHSMPSYSPFKNVPFPFPCRTTRTSPQKVLADQLPCTSLSTPFFVRESFFFRRDVPFSWFQPQAFLVVMTSCCSAR